MEFQPSEKIDKMMYTVWVSLLLNIYKDRVQTEDRRWYFSFLKHQKTLGPSFLPFDVEACRIKYKCDYFSFFHSICVFFTALHCTKSSCQSWPFSNYFLKMKWMTCTNRNIVENRKRSTHLDQYFIPDSGNTVSRMHSAEPELSRDQGNSISAGQARGTRQLQNHRSNH